MVVTLYEVAGSPPCYSVKMGLKYLGINAELIPLDFASKEQETPEYRRINPIGEVPCLDDEGFLLSESVAILQYLADKYKRDDTFYPSDLQRRAVVNKWLAFHSTTYYRTIVDYWLNPTFIGSPKTELNYKRLWEAVAGFEALLLHHNSLYVAGENVTIADLPMVVGTSCLEAIGFDLKPFPNITNWYLRFKSEQSGVWRIGIEALASFKQFVLNPPKVSTF